MSVPFDCRFFSPLSSISPDNFFPSAFPSFAFFYRNFLLLLFYTFFKLDEAAANESRKIIVYWVKMSMKYLIFHQPFTKTIYSASNTNIQLKKYDKSEIEEKFSLRGNFFFFFCDKWNFFSIKLKWSEMEKFDLFFLPLSSAFILWFPIPFYQLNSQWNECSQNIIALKCQEWYLPIRVSTDWIWIFWIGEKIVRENQILKLKIRFAHTLTTNSMISLSKFDVEAELI